MGIFDEDPKLVVNRCVVRLSTTYFKRGSACVLSKDLFCLRRKCEGYNLLEEHVGDVGVEEVLSCIVNLNTAEDGIYELIMINESYDRESGWLDSWDYELVKYNE